jgi:hypothetical protein
LLLFHRPCLQNHQPTIINQPNKMKIKLSSSRSTAFAAFTQRAARMTAAIFAALLAVHPLHAEDGFKTVIRWNMDGLNEAGQVPNEIQDGPYAEAVLILNGAEIVDDHERGKVLFFNGVDATAESLSAWEGHTGVRVSVWVRNEDKNGQSIIVRAGPFSLFKMAQHVKFRTATEMVPNIRDENVLGAPGLVVGKWVLVTAEFNPELSKATLECDGKVSDMEFPEGDILINSNRHFLMGNKLNRHFYGWIDEVVIEVKD